MNYKLKILLAVISMSFVTVGCGGGGGGGSNNAPVESSAKSILVGNIFYYANDYLDFEDGYYKDYFDSASATETEHMSDGTILYSDTVSVSYSGTNVTFNIDGTNNTCGVTRQEKSVLLSCPSLSSDKYIWDTIEDAKANPQP